MKYLLDLTTLLIFLVDKKQNGEISADLKRLSGTAHKGPYHARIRLSGGNVVFCVIQDREGHIFMDGEKALHELKQATHNEWEWSSTPSPPSVVLTTPTRPPEENRGRPKDITALIPRHAFPLENMNKNALPRRYWQVLLLINGSRTISQIASMLTSSPATADLQKLIDILKDLQERGLIIVRNN